MKQTVIMVEGEARFLRGWAYFELTRYFGLPYEAGTANNQPAVPIVLTPTKGCGRCCQCSEKHCCRVLCTRLLNDLTAARDLLPEENDVYASSPRCKGNHCQDASSDG
ncbi:MAG: RagB/SusD family nutrient uptake outer membrane protein [Marinilabiliales bacterium]|nr:RagB/SusD family nutrient uptake outer membrane protein [Marinilabiliales bacterium]